MEAAVLLIYEVRVRAEHLRVQEWVDAQLLKITRTLLYFENNICELEKGINMGSLSVAISLDYLDFRHKNINWQKTYPKLFTWYASIKDRKSLSDTMPVD